MTKQRIHREWFRPVHTKSIYTLKIRPPELIEEIMQRSCNLALSPKEKLILRNELGQPYKSFDGYESRRKSCPECKAKLELNEFVWSWGEYHNARWNTVCHFCKSCFPTEVLQRLIDHREECGCDYELVAKDCTLPSWLTLPDTCSVDMSTPDMHETKRPSNEADEHSNYGLL